MFHVIRFSAVCLALALPLVGPGCGESFSPGPGGTGGSSPTTTGSEPTMPTSTGTSSETTSATSTTTPTGTGTTTTSGTGTGPPSGCEGLTIVPAEPAAGEPIAVTVSTTGSCTIGVSQAENDLLTVNLIEEGDYDYTWSIEGSSVGMLNIVVTCSPEGTYDCQLTITG